jgi:putative membrane protein
VLRADDDVSAWFTSARWRPVLFASGLLIAFLALQSPIDRAGDDYLFSIHMVQHLLLMMLAPPPVLLGICGMRALPRNRFRAWRRVWWLLTRPWIALLLFNAVMLLWHVPALYDTTLRVEPLHVAEHLSFMAVGVLFWWPIIEPIRDQQTTLVSPLEKIAVLVVSGIPPTVLGLIFALSRTPYYQFYVHAPRLWGLSPVFDQQIGGVIMLGAGNIIYFVAIVTIFMRLLGNAAQDEEEAARRLGAARVVGRPETPAVSQPPSPRIYAVSTTFDGSDAARPVVASAEGGHG